MAASASKFSRLEYFFNQGVNKLNELVKLSGYSLASVKRNLKKIKRCSPMKQGKNGGRRSIYGANDRRRLYQIAIKNPSWSSIKIRTRLVQLGSPFVSTRTIQRLLLDLNFKYILPKTVPFLSNDHKQVRLNWCKNHRYTNFENWIFTDESSFQLYRNTVKLWTKFDHVKNKPRPKGRKSVMVWAGISARGITPIHLVNGRINSAYYCDILNECLIENMSLLYPDGFILQADNAPIHVSMETQLWLVENNINSIKWPSCSPDLNPIENIWSILKRQVELENPRNLSDLKQAIIKCWNELDFNHVKSVLGSMQNRIELCIAANGGLVKY